MDFAAFGGGGGGGARLEANLARENRDTGGAVVVFGCCFCSQPVPNVSDASSLLGLDRVGCRCCCSISEAGPVCSARPLAAP